MIGVFALQISHAQIINIPDANFKNVLVNWNCADFDGDGNADGTVDTNNDGEIQVSEAEIVVGLDIDQRNIQSLEGIFYFINLKTLYCRQNQLTTLDISNNSNLETLDCRSNQLATLDISNNTNLETLSCSGNQLTTLDLINNSNLKSLNCSGNQLTTLDISNNSNLEILTCRVNQLTTLDISNNLNLRTLQCNDNQLTTLDVSNNLNLTTLSCDNNQLTTLDVSNNSSLSSLFCQENELVDINLGSGLNLIWLSCGFNQLTSLDVSNTNVSELDCHNNQLTTLDLSNHSGLGFVNCSHNMLNNLILDNNSSLFGLLCHDNQLTTLDLSTTMCRWLSASNNDLTYVNMKNGFDIETSSLSNNPNLEYICVDQGAEEILVSSLVANDNTINPVVGTYCSFTPGSTFYTITGEVNANLNNTNCDTAVPFSKFHITNGVTNGVFFTDNTGDFSIPLQAGTYTITPELENPGYFNVTPASISVDFPTDASPLVQDFCITPNGAHNDLSVTLLPTNEAKPGFDSDYKIIYANHGTTVQSGAIELTFQDAVMGVVSANPTTDTQSTNTLSWNYIDLMPLESRIIEVSFNLNTPTELPALNAGDILTFTTNINPMGSDATPSNNSFTLNQTVVNSFDPNDKTCLEGDTVSPETIGAYVHYLIRFENLGTANAVNVVVKDIINTAMFDVNTLIPIRASHDFYTRIQDTNKVEFIFENINLPFDDANNDGYILFKIKTLNTLVEGDTLENDAEIYFDFNFPIVTDLAITSINGTLGLDSNDAVQFSIHPNPVRDRLHVSGTDPIKTITIYDIIGRPIQHISYTSHSTEASIPVETLATGTYFVEMTTSTGRGVKKLLKQ